MDVDVAAVAARLRDEIGPVDSAIVLGSGWAPLLASADGIRSRMTYAEVGLRPPVAPGHDGELAVVEVGQKRVLVFSGRTHLYEGHGPQAVAANVRVAAALGARTLVLTNANGTFHRDWQLGDVVVLTDHLNRTGTSPLVGANFVDLTNLYDAGLRAEFLARAGEAGVPTREGVYAMLAGPHYETAAEAVALAKLGADVIGMSTALEAIAAREAGMTILGLSIVTAIENSGQEIDPDEVVRIAEEQAAKLSPIVLGMLS